MQNITVNLRLRPIRFAFIVRPDDEKHILEIFQINACLWGGKFNPIIPFFKEVPEWWDRFDVKYETANQIINGYLDFFEPDFIVEAEPGLANDYGFDSPRVIQLKDVLSSEGHCGEGGYGCRVTELYEHLYDKSFQYQRRHKSNIVCVATQQKEWESFVACVFGMFPSHENLKYFEDEYRKTFDPQITELNTDSLISFYESKQNDLLKMGSNNIGTYYHGYQTPVLYFLDLEKPYDLIDYWNLRTIYRDLYAIPIQWFQELLPFCKRIILKNVHPFSNNLENRMMYTSLIFSRSITVTMSDEIMKKHFQEELKESKIISEPYPFIWQNSRSSTEKRATLVMDKTAINLPYVDDNVPYSINTLTPEFGKNTLSPFFKWANIIQLQDSSHKDEIATVFPSEYRKQMAIKHHDLFAHIVSTTEGLVYLVKYNTPSAMFPITDGATAIQNWLYSRGVESTIFSDAGKIAEQIIKTLGGFNGVRSVANKDIVTLLDDMSRKSLKSMPSNLFKNKINLAVKNKVLYDVFESLVKNRAVELGSEIKCEKCDHWSWYSIKQLDYQLTCNFCLQRLEFPITCVDDSKTLRYAYRLAGAFALNNFATGGYAAALAMRFFGQLYCNMTQSEITWSAGQELTFSDGKKIEADFILWLQKKSSFFHKDATEIIFGEAKSFAQDAFTQNDIDKMQLLAEAFPGSYLAFATLKEKLSQEEIRRIKELAEWAQVYDQDRSQPRARIIVLTGIELFTDWFVVQTWKDKGGKHTELLGDSGATSNRMNLEYLANTTQQLYLGMP